MDAMTSYAKANIAVKIMDGYAFSMRKIAVLNYIFKCSEMSVCKL